MGASVVAAAQRLVGVTVDGLDAAVTLLAAEVALRDPTDRRGLFPLLVPLAEDEAGGTIGLLRWPTPGDAPFPLVRADSGGVVRLARSPRAFVEERLVVADVHDRWTTVHNAIATGVYARGTVTAGDDPERSAAVYLLRRVGWSQARFEAMIVSHLGRGDVDAALITADRALRDSEGWARPHLIRARTLASLGREASEAARMALLEPMWTLGERAFAELSSLAGHRPPFDGSGFRRLADDARLPVLDRAAHRLDAAFVDGEPWDVVRPAVAAAYAEGGLRHVAVLVGGEAHDGATPAD
jgi:hypothetical protein